MAFFFNVLYLYLLSSPSFKVYLSWVLGGGCGESNLHRRSPEPTRIKLASLLLALLLGPSHIQPEVPSSWGCSERGLGARDKHL